jgi:hypothetical protein
MPLSLRPAQTFVRSDDPAAEDDFDVFDGKRRVGRLYWQSHSAEPWRWRLSGNLISQPLMRGEKPVNPPNGRAETRSKALQALKAAYDRVSTDPAKP